MISARETVLQQLISKTKEVECIDVCDNNKTKMPLRLYSGQKLPYKGNEFDTSILIYVLHHTDSPEKLIKEAVRVTKKRIIVFEDVYTGPVSLFLLKLLDLGNCFTSKGINLPFAFRKEDEWLSMLKRYGKVEVKKIPMILPRKQLMFIVSLA